MMINIQRWPVDARTLAAEILNFFKFHDLLKAENKLIFRAIVQWSHGQCEKRRFLLLRRAQARTNRSIRLGGKTYY